MAINAQKFLPSSKSSALVKTTSSIARQSSDGVVGDSSQKNLGIINFKLIEIDKILKGTLASQKKELDDKKRQESTKRREKIEEKLETKTNTEKGKIDKPKVPRLGIFDWIKNFIGNVILGYFAVRLVDHLPKIIPIVKFLGAATDFVLNLGGKLLDGLVTFVDWGYKAVDFSRGMIGKTFGDDALKNFDKLAVEFEKFMNLAIIAGMVSADFGMDRLTKSRKGAERASQKAAGSIGRRGAGRAVTRAATRVGGKGAGKLAAKVGSKVLKAVPLLGAGLSILEGIMRIKEGDYTGGLLSFGTAIPIAGWAFLAIDIAREFVGKSEFDKIAGRAFSGKSGLTDKQVRERTPHLSGPSFMGLASGGITRAGKTQGRPRRTVPKGRKGKYKRKLSPKKPTEVDIKAGSDIGGEEKILGLFPKPKLPEFMNPFKVIRNAGKTLGSSDYFGPILAITSKILLGQEPTQKDYQNVGLGINLLISKGLNEGKLSGGLMAAFAEGGFVDVKSLDAVIEGGDISEWVAKAFKESTENNAEKTLREIRNNLNLKKIGGEGQPAPTPADMGEGGGVQVSSDSPDFWLLATAAMFENSDPQGAADVAQAIYNRVAMPGDPWNTDNSITKAILNPNQFQPVRQYGGTAAWARIKTKDDAIRFSKSYGKTQEQLETVAAALLDQNKQKSARQFVGPRDSFRSYSYEDANNHLANETEVRRYGHAFGFEPRGSTIGLFKAGKLSAAQVNAGVVGTVSQKGLPPLPPTNTLPGKQHYGALRDGGRRHAGVDFDAPDNGTFYSRIGGEVKFIGNEPGGYYKYVDIYNPQLGVTERIAEGDNILVRVGQKVSRGAAVSSGTRSTGVFHYEIRRGSGTTYGFEGTVDPIKFLSGGSRFHGGPVTKTGYLFTHKGEFVIDKDSVDLFGLDIFDTFNRVENRVQLAAKTPSIIEKLKSISGYADYEQPYSQTEIIKVEVPVPNSINVDSPSGSSLSLMVKNEQNDPFDSLYVGS